VKYLLPASCAIVLAVGVASTVWHEYKQHSAYEVEHQGRMEFCVHKAAGFTGSWEKFDQAAFDTCRTEYADK
jgi:hypothetical protein